MEMHQDVDGTDEDEMDDHMAWRYTVAHIDLDCHRLSMAVPPPEWMKEVKRLLLAEWMKESSVLLSSGDPHNRATMTLLKNSRPTLR
ncbi:hypothetical protein C4D60_Mb09t19200 [Musa balbisiana]|uniref:Uncharacterized protein n=1 Tax=Musa balbisiana TaxID=52838 RepID=A0A4S8IIV5_MUSBA|nr:hypothetical protein C4D60_Mb09t19200 [Musa balbisiana]